MRALEPFNVTVTFCFTPESHGIRPHIRAPSRRKGVRRILRRPGPKVFLAQSQRFVIMSERRRPVFDTRHLQVASAVQRLTALQRRAGQATAPTPRLFEEVLGELAHALEELQVTQQHLIEQRDELVAARHQLQIEREKYWQLFDGAPDAYVITTPDVQIVDANRAAADLLNISQRFLVGKNFSIFVCNDRTQLLAQALEIAQTRASANLSFSVRPRERAPFSVNARVVAAAEPVDASLRWMLRRIEQPARVEALSQT
jgi:PAS domain S-box-containing protein